MLLRSSISTTKKFFKKTLKGFKSFLSQDYQRLPKTPLFKFNPFSFQNPGSTAIDTNLMSQTITQELDMFYAEVTQRLDRDKHKPKKRRSMKKIVSPPQVKSEQEVYAKWGSGKNCEVEVEVEEKKRLMCEGKIKEKLKELEMMDKGNIEHVLDIEEARHYYSRLTCSAYVAIVDKFFMEIFAEISSMAPSNR
ncbi:hypothetical protein Vadar_026699 [Vaccinium darrowii]|uniref:Uncharacterized protein n=1 Tax=Vaccinium darrowii TaxID=229202 RepID=A0ACB7YA83_9ERIC|nr:hypothetical protein Vadar_026699 [Vaccinium darrowii]